MSIVEGACKEYLPSQQAQQLPAGILVWRGTQDREWGQLKGGKHTFPSIELQTHRYTFRPLKYGEVEGFWLSFKSPLISTRDSIPQTDGSAPTKLNWIHLQLHRTRCLTKISVQKNILQTKRKAHWSFFLFPLFLTVQPRRTACERFHWAEKVLLTQSANLVPSMIHNVVWSPVCL